MATYTFNDWTWGALWAERGFSDMGLNTLILRFRLDFPAKESACWSLIDQASVYVQLGPHQKNNERRGPYLTVSFKHLLTKTLAIAVRKGGIDNCSQVVFTFCKCLHLSQASCKTIQMAPRQKWQDPSVEKRWRQILDKSLDVPKLFCPVWYISSGVGNEGD